MIGSPGALDRVVADILASRKYAHVAPAVVRRVAAEALAVERGEEAASRRARRKLHQAYGAFGAAGDHARIEELVAAIEALDPGRRSELSDDVRRASGKLLALHASTAERLPILEDFYRAVLPVEPAGPSPAARILDLGCGLGPFALPWMGLAAGAAYHALDLDGRTSALVERYLAALGRPGAAAAGDLLAEVPWPGPWDVVLLLKTAPTLERQARGATARLARSLDTRLLASSFPRASLGGRRKGMDRQYVELMAGVAAEAGLELERLEWPSEAVYLCRRARAPVGLA